MLAMIKENAIMLKVNKTVKFACKRRFTQQPTINGPHRKLVLTAKPGHANTM